ncbi:MAG TPA: hypothetical protein VJ893_02795 [Roseovarius sp.]|nr:hypothetical protein [Roseovarius sp.]
MNKNLVYIVSGGRTGTQYFGDLMSDLIEDTFSVHEPDLLDPFDPLRLVRATRVFGINHMIFGRIAGRTGIRNIARRWQCGLVDRAAIADAIRAHRDAYYRTVPNSLIIESYYQWYGLADVVRDVYPRCKVIGLVRDPRDWVTSWLNHGGQHDRRDLTRLFGQRRLRPDDFGQTELMARWPEARRFEKHCWDWWMINSRITEAAAVSDLTRVWRFEDVFTSDDPSHLESLLYFAAEHGARRYDVTFDPAIRQERRNASRGRAPGWRAWDCEQARCLERHCGPLMRVYGYGLEPEWQAKLQG